MNSALNRTNGRGRVGEDFRVAVASCVLLPTIRILLRRRGLQATADWLVARSDGPSVSAAPDLCPNLSKHVSSISKLPVFGGTCLPKSLTTWFLLRRRGVDAVIVIGADALVFDALTVHAWVEVDGIPLDELADVRERFGSFGFELPRLAPIQR